MHNNSGSRLAQYLDAIERWREEADSPTYIDALISTPVRDLQTTQQPARVNLNSSILQAVESFKDTESIVVNKVVFDGDDINIAELIFTRFAFLEHALQAPSFLDSLSAVIDNIPSLGWVDDSDTLDVALQRMISTGFDLVGIMSEGMMAGVLHVNDVFNFLQREVAVATQNEKPAPRLGTQSTFRSVGTHKNLRAERDADKKEMSQLRISAIEWCQSGWTECLLMCCILLDLICVFVEWETSSDDEEKLLVATGIILFVFVFEVLVRLVGRRATLLYLPFEILDVSIVLASALVYIVVIASDLSSNSSSKTVVTCMRVLRLLRQIKILRYLYRIYKSKKMRYCQDGFNLDISYITNTCIAMSQPVLIPYGILVNPIKEIYRFFSTKYPGRYLIFNLCAETSYGDEVFGGRAERISIENHNPPKIHQMVTFVEHAGRFLEEHPDSCIAVHCSGGIARTGVMTAAWLLYSTFSDTAQDAIKWFLMRRTGNIDDAGDNEMLTPSQIRYIEYMEKLVQDGGYCTKRLVLSRLLVQSCPRMDAGGGCNLWFTVEEGEKEIYCSSEHADSYCRMEKNQSELPFEVDLLVSSDIRITFYHQDITHGREHLCFFVCFHTGFIQANSFVFSKGCIDIAATDVKHRIFDQDFALVLDFKDIPVPKSSEPTNNGTMFGAFRKILKPSSSVTESAALMRCRDSSVQAKVAKRLKTKVSFDFGLDIGITANCFTQSSEAMYEDIEESKESLCSASGPPVKHEAVDMFKAEAEAVLTPFKQTTLTKSSSLDALKPLKRSVQGIARSLVSGNKRRFLGEGFDLDLTYITPRIIAMGFPSSGMESNYRNSAEDVYRFFQERHAAHYLIVNLCSEREYDLDTFHRNGVRYPFDDHTPPALELILPCCAFIHKYLQADVNNVVAIHCKAGKGRTGLIVVSYLMYCGLKGSSTSARHFYDWSRTKDGKGLTIISQIRYAHYFEQQLKCIKYGKVPIRVAQDEAIALNLMRCRLHGMPRWDSHKSCSPSLSIRARSQKDHKPYEIFKSRSDGYVHNKQHDSCDIDLMNDSEGVRVAGDFVIYFYHQDKLKLFSFWLHSEMVINPPSEMGGTVKQLSDSECQTEGLPPSSWSLILSKHEIDTAAKDKRCNRFKATFKVELFFSPLQGQTGTGDALDAATEKISESSLVTEDPPLHTDKQFYQKVVQVALSLGQSAPSFEDYLLGRCQGLSSLVTGSGTVKRSFHSSKRSGLTGQDLSAPVTPKLSVSFMAADLGFPKSDSKKNSFEFDPLDRFSLSSGLVSTRPADSPQPQHHEIEELSSHGSADPTAGNPPWSHKVHDHRMTKLENASMASKHRSTPSIDSSSVRSQGSFSMNTADEAEAEKDAVSIFVHGTPSKLKMAPPDLVWDVQQDGISAQVVHSPLSSCGGMKDDGRQNLTPSKQPAVLTMF